MTDTLVRDDTAVLPAPVAGQAPARPPAGPGLPEYPDYLDRRTAARRGLARVRELVATVPPGGVVLALVLLLPVGGLLRQSGPLLSGQLMEQGFMLVLPHQVLHGAVANRDFHFFWGPLGLWVPAVFHAVFGWTEGAARLLGLGYAAGMVAAAYGIARRWSEPIGVAAGVGMALVNRLSDLPQYGALALTLGVVYCGRRALAAPSGSAPGRRWALAAGLLAGATILFRPDRGAGAVAALAVLLAGAQARGVRRWAGAGVGVGVVLLGGHALVAGPSRVVGDLFWSALHVPAERRLAPPLSHLPLDVWLSLVLVGTGTLLAAGRRRSRLCPRSPRGPVLLSLGVLSLLLLPEYAQRSDAGHLLVAGCVAVAFLPAALADLAMDRRARAVPGGWALRAVAVVGVAFLAGSWGESAHPYLYETAATLGLAHPDAVAVHNLGRSFVYPAAQARSVEEVLSRVQALTRPGQRLFVGPYDLRRTPYADDSIAALLPELRPLMAFPDMHPLVAVNHGAALAHEVASADVLVLNAQIDGWSEANESARYGSDAAESVLAHDFCDAGNYGPYRVMLRCSRLAGAEYR